jgi:hypothetical protein
MIPLGGAGAPLLAKLLDASVQWCWRRMFGRDLVLSKRAGTVLAYGILLAFFAGLTGYGYWLMSWDE